VNGATRATLIGLVGVLLVRLSLQGTFQRYVRSGMGPWLALAGTALLVVAVATFWRSRAGDAPDDHDHDHGGRAVAWLLVAPVLVLLLVAPPALGSYALGRTGQAVSVEGGSTAFATLDPGAAPLDMTLLEFDQRAFEGDHQGASFGGATVALTGFVAPADGEGFVVARFLIACCAADALAASAHVVGWDGPAPETDTWVIVTGRFEPGGGDTPRLRAETVTPIDEPVDPYE
jgi:uncharacterized repeat protein (TIGR03943 family)